MKISKILLLAALIFSGSCGRASAQKINTEAIEAFWKVIDRLKADQPLTDSLWNTYYSLYGNRVYIKKNLGDWAAAVHRGYLELVFRPSLADSLQKCAPAKNQDLNEFLFQNLWYIKEHEMALRDYISVISSPGYVPLAIDLAKKYLPENRYNPMPANLTIYLMAIASDGAVQDSSMYYGISIVYSYDRFRKTAIPAHEFSHLLRVEKPMTGKLTAADSASFDAVDEINNEGVADLIDKTVLEAHTDSIIRGKVGLRKFLSSAPETVRALDTALAADEPGNANPPTADRFGGIIRGSSGHIPGFFMVRVIRRNGLVAELIKGCDNPFGFFYLYQKAAEMDAAHPPLFSKKTMANLQRLERAAYP